MGEKRTTCSLLVRKPEVERDSYEGQDVGWWMILSWILERDDGVVSTGLVFLRIGTSGELL
jgi:hypothetical protein